MIDIAILGGGVSALALAANLKKDFLILEKQNKTGGLCSSIVEQGFTFDVAGPHILFSKNQNILNYMKSLLGENIIRKFRTSKILYKNKYVKYPFENGLSDLPKEDCFECIRDYLSNNFNKNPSNLAEWSYATFGKSISEKYLLPYNRKIWNCDPSSISLDWVSRIPKPPLEDVLKSAIGISTEGYLHQLYFSYPKTGGFQAITDALTEKVKNKLFLNEEVIKIEKIENGWNITTNKNIICAKNIVSTIPIHKLINILHSSPKEAIELSNKLRFNGLINVLIGLSYDHKISYPTIYVPDPTVDFHRLTIPSNFSENNTPNGQSSIMVEITANNEDDIWKLSDKDILNKITNDLERLNIIEADKVIYSKVIKITYAYPVCDLNYKENVEKIRNLIENTGIHLLGRFGNFEYINSDVCVEQAFALAEKLNG